MRRASVVVLLATAIAVGAATAHAEPDIDEPDPNSPTAMAITEELGRFDAARSHLYRNLVWGSASVLGGGALWSTAGDNDEFQRAFGLQTMVWGGIDLAIVGAGFLYMSTLEPATDRKKIVDRERLYHDSLLFNMGLDVAYMSIGATLLVAAENANSDRKRDAWRGHGTAIVIQGAALFALETAALIGSRRRLGRLLFPRLVLVPTVAPGSVGLAARFSL